MASTGDTAGPEGPSEDELVAAVGDGAYRHELRGRWDLDDDALRARLDDAVAAGLLAVVRTHAGHVTRYVPPQPDTGDDAPLAGRTRRAPSGP